MSDTEDPSEPSMSPRPRRTRPADGSWIQQFVDLFRAHREGPEVFKEVWAENRRSIEEPLEEGEIDDGPFLAAHAIRIEDFDLFERPRRQAYFFAHRFLPNRVATMPRAMIENLRAESATRYLKTHWMLASLSLELAPEDMADGEQLECFQVEIGDSHRAAVVRMPTPERRTEAYYVAVVVGEAEDADARVDYRFITLELSVDDDGMKHTILGEWTGPDGDTHANYGSGPVPELELFIAAVRDLLERG